MTLELDKDELYQQEFEAALERKRFILPYKSQIKFIWDLIIIIFAIFNSFYLPLDIAHKEEMKKIPTLVRLDESTVYIFFLDMVLGFNTSYFNTQTGEEVFGYKFVAKHYIF